MGELRPGRGARGEQSWVTFLSAWLAGYAAASRPDTGDDDLIAQARGDFERHGDMLAVAGRHAPEDN